MPLLPPEVDLPLDPRLEPYRDRAALLYRGDVQIGHVFVETAWHVVQTGGRFWWRRWSEPTEAVQIYTVLDSAATDSVETPGAFDELLAQWSAGELEFNGEVLRLRWLSDRDSRLAEEQELWVSASLEGRIERARRLWRMHKAAPYPPKFRDAEVAGIDLVQLDTALADGLIAWIANGGRIEADKYDALRRLVEDADRVVPSLVGQERVRFRRLQRMAALAYGATDRAGA